MLGQRKRFRDYITQKDNHSVLCSMIKVLTEGNKKTLRELLFLLLSCFGEAELSVVSSNTRCVVATTREDEKCAEDVALRVKDPQKRFYYFREEENGMFFVKGIGCIRIYPLSSMGGEECFLMVEQKENMDNSSERMLDIVSIATRIHLQEVSRQDLLKKDILTGLGNRDSLQEVLTGFTPEECRDVYIGIYSICNLQELVITEGMVSVDSTIRHVADVIDEYFHGQTYRVGDYKFCVWQKGGTYEIVSTMQTCLDKLFENLPKVEFCCVATPSISGYYKAMYLCEKASDVEKGDTVLLIREKDVVFDIGETETGLFMAAIQRKKEGKGIYEEVCYPKDDVEEMGEESSHFDADFVNMDEFMDG